MTVFIAGSRAFSKLNAIIRARLDNLISRGCTIFIGDANGADKAVQQYFADRAYQNVLVFCTEKCRNNVGGWPARIIEPQSHRKDFTYYAIKDIAMAHEAKCGIMLWDGKSKGTLQNMLNLIGSGKRTLVYFAPTKDFHVVTNEQELQALLALCNKVHLERAERGLGLSSLQQPHLPLRNS